MRFFMDLEATKSSVITFKPGSHTSPRQNPAILLRPRGVATPMCYEKMTRNSVHLFFNRPFKNPSINVTNKMSGH